MTKPIRLEIKLPFEGFYETLYSGAIDHAESSDCEYHAEKECSQEYYPDTYQPEELRLDAGDYQNIFMSCANYSGAYRQLAEYYVDAFNDLLRDKDLDLDLKFADMTSPREYNFTTDRLFATIPLKQVKAMFALSKQDGHKVLLETIKERHSSRSGFCSYYRTDASAWLEKPIDDWDHNELETLLIAALKLKGIDVEGEDERWALYYSTIDSEGDYHAFSECVDWAKFEELVNDKREEKREELDEDHPLRAPPAERPYRCTETLDLFEAPKS